MVDGGQPGGFDHAGREILGLQPLDVEWRAWFPSTGREQSIDQWTEKNEKEQNERRGKRTAHFLPEHEQLPNRELGAADAADDGPLALVLDGPSDNAGEVLRRGERDAVLVAQREGAASVEVDRRLKGAEVSGRRVRVGEVVCEQAWLEEGVF